MLLLCLYTTERERGAALHERTQETHRERDENNTHRHRESAAERTGDSTREMRQRRAEMREKKHEFVGRFFHFRLRRGGGFFFENLGPNFF